MVEQKIPEPVARQTGALLTCGVLAGPLYTAVTAIQALTRDGFDPRQVYLGRREADVVMTSV
jgi:hypothetical protein